MDLPLSSAAAAPAAAWPLPPTRAAGPADEGREDAHGFADVLAASTADADAQEGGVDPEPPAAPQPASEAFWRGPVAVAVPPLHVAEGAAAGTPADAEATLAAVGVPDDNAPTPGDDTVAAWAVATQLPVFEMPAPTSSASVPASRASTPPPPSSPWLPPSTAPMPLPTPLPTPLPAPRPVAMPPTAAAGGVADGADTGPGWEPRAAPSNAPQAVTTASDAPQPVTTVAIGTAAPTPVGPLGGGAGLPSSGADPSAAGAAARTAAPFADGPGDASVKTEPAARVGVAPAAPHAATRPPIVNSGAGSAAALDVPAAAVVAEAMSAPAGHPPIGIGAVPGDVETTSRAASRTTRHEAPNAGQRADSASRAVAFSELSGEQERSSGNGASRHPGEVTAAFEAAGAPTARPEGGEAHSLPVAPTATTAAAPRATPIDGAAPPPPLTDPRVEAANVARLVESMRVQIRQGAGEATVRLKPEHLGEVTIAIRVERGVVSAVVHAETPAVQQWLEAQEERLRNGLAEQGLQLDRFIVHRDRQERREQRQQQPPPARYRTPQSGHRESGQRFEISV